MKYFRVNGVSWWPEEMPSQDEMDEGIQSLEKENWKVDFVMTHDGTSSVKAFVSHGAVKPDELNVYLEEIKQKLYYKKWFWFGTFIRVSVRDNNCDESLCSSDQRT